MQSIIGYLLNAGCQVSCGYEEEKTDMLESIFKIIHAQANGFFEVFLKIK